MRCAGKKIRLRDFDADYTGGTTKGTQAQAELDKNVGKLDDLGYRLYAENRRSLLLVLQGMDTAGKDGTIRHVMQGFNPQSCQVTSFKQPGVDELAHDFLWRIYRAARARASSASSTARTTKTCWSCGCTILCPKGMGKPLRADQSVRANCCTTPARRSSRFLAHQQGRAAAAAAIAAGRSEEAVEVQPGRHRGAQLLGRLPAGVRGGDDPLQHAARPVVHRAGQPQVVSQPGDQPTFCERRWKKWTRSIPRPKRA